MIMEFLFHGSFFFTKTNSLSKYLNLLYLSNYYLFSFSDAKSCNCNLMTFIVHSPAILCKKIFISNECANLVLQKKVISCKNAQLLRTRIYCLVETKHMHDAPSQKKALELRYRVTHKG